ncbi:MAG: right-handed parallel beta-helix repeat-containing protein [Cyclobacteriaceae bacterium]
MKFKKSWTKARSSFLIVLAVFSIGSSVLGKDIFVSPSGNDGSNGSFQHPLGSMEGARNLIRKWKAEGPLKESVQVIFLEGDYYLDQPVIFNEEDSGTSEFPIIYKGEEQKEVNFYGGKLITGWEETAEGLWKTRLLTKAWKFEQLYINGNRAVRARTPNLGKYLQVEGVNETILSGENDRVASFAVQEIGLDKKDFLQLGLSKDTGWEDILVVFYHKWDNTRKFLQAIDPEKGSFFISGQGMKPWNPINKDSRFYLENFRSALDEPGEWYLENDGTLYYMPLPGQNLAEARIFAPFIEQFLRLQGADPHNKIQDLKFINLNFKYSGYTTPKRGNEPAQAAAPIPSVITVDQANRITFENCEVAHTGTGAFWFRNAVENSEIQRCYLHDLGAGGVKIGPLSSGDPENPASWVSRNNLIHNNIIRSGGWVFPCAVGAMIFHASDNEISNNEIADFRYTGISVGWVWGYTPSFAKRNKVKYNHIHHLGWGDLSDMGGVYTLGLSEGTEVSHNIIHHIYSMTYGGWGLYTDEGSTGILMENNLVYACKNAGFHQHYGKNNRIRNNIFAYNQLSQLQATRVEDHISFYFTNNIILFNEGALLSSNWAKINLVTDRNIYWDERGKDIDFSNLSFPEWKTMGNDLNSKIIDPGFISPLQYDFTFKNKSAIRKINFEPFSLDEVGVYGDKEWVELAQFDPVRASLFDEIIRKNEEIQK